MFNLASATVSLVTDANILTNLSSMQENEEIILSDLSERFLQAMNYREVTGYQLKKDGVINNESTLTKIKQGKQKPSPKTIDSFCEIYLIDRSWMYTGEGDMDPKVRAEKINKGTVEPIVFYEDKEDDKDCLNHSNSIVIKPNKGEIPILDIRVCAGHGIGFDGNENKIISTVSIPDFSGCYGITVYGDSMYDKYQSGEIIFVREILDKSVIDNGQPYVVITKEDRLLKLLYVEDNGLKLVSYNTTLNPDGRRKYPDINLDGNQILHLYKVVGNLGRTQL